MKNFQIKCEMCGTLSPTTNIEDDVVDIAIDAGWEINGDNDFDRDLCPNCIIERNRTNKWKESGFHTMAIGPSINMVELKRRRFGK